MWSYVLMMDVILCILKLIQIEKWNRWIDYGRNRKMTLKKKIATSQIR